MMHSEHPLRDSRRVEGGGLLDRCAHPEVPPPPPRCLRTSSPLQARAARGPRGRSVARMKGAVARNSIDSSWRRPRPIWLKRGSNVAGNLGGSGLRLAAAAIAWSMRSRASSNTSFAGTEGAMPVGGEGGTRSSTGQALPASILRSTSWNKSMNPLGTRLRDGDLARNKCRASSSTKSR